MNVWKQFEALLPADPLLVGQVLSHNSDGTSSVTLPGAQIIRAQGQSVPVGNFAFVQTGRVQGDAPNLPSVEVPI